MRHVCLILAFVTCSGAFALDRIPDEVFVRHAKALLPELIEETNARFGRRLEIDPASVKVSTLRIGDVVHPAQAEVTALHLMIPIRPENECRRVEATSPDGRTTVRVNVRSVGPRFRLVRSCRVDDDRPPLLHLGGAGAAPIRFDDAELFARARPMLEALVRTVGPGAAIDWTSPHARHPWWTYLTPPVSENDYFERGPRHACYRIALNLTSPHRSATTALDVTFDTEDRLNEVPAAYQTVVNDAARLRQLRFALVKGCRKADRARPPVLRLR